LKELEGNWNGAAGPNKYQYNGKEWNDDFGLSWNDYGARFYDPAVGNVPHSLNFIKMIFRIIFTIILFFQCFCSFACDCRRPIFDLPINDFGLHLSNDLNTKPSNLIFFGKLKAISTVRKIVRGIERSFIEMAFETILVFKGDSTKIIKVYTPNSDCAFIGAIGDESIIFTTYDDDISTTYASNCCRSVNSRSEPLRFQRYLYFLSTIRFKPDGKFNFYQSVDMYNLNKQFAQDSFLILSFSIKNHLIDGDWLVLDQTKSAIEKGHFKLSKREGLWFVESHSKANSSKPSTTTSDVILYKDDRIDTQLTVIHEYELRASQTAQNSDNLSSLGAMQVVFLKKKVIQDDKVILEEKY
jgi:hypothetical protein